MFSHGPNFNKELDDLLGVTSALDQQIDFSFFDGLTFNSPRVDRLSLRQFASRMADVKRPTKSTLPLMKLASFDGGAKAEHVRSLHGIEADYDGKTVAGISPDEAAARLRQANIAALIFTSSSHKPDAPRWRVLCPTAKPVSPDRMIELVDRLNGALGGILDSESWTNGRRYFYGQTNDAAPLETQLIDGRTIDAATDLPRIGKRSDPQNNTDAELAALLGDPIPSPADDFDDLDDIERANEPDYERIKSALKAIKDAEDRELWRDIGMALHQESYGADRAFKIWCGWSQRSDKFNLKDSRYQWKEFGRYTGKAIGIATLYHHAEQWGWTDSEKKPVAPSRLSFLSPSDCDAAPSRGYVIKGFVAPQDVACVFGAPGAGKSLIAPFLGYSVAQGREAFGMRTKGEKVFYVAAEDPHGMRGRVKALRQEHGDAENFTLIEGVSDLLSDESPDFAALADAVKQQKPALIFIDTLAMAFPGLEENSAEAMGRVVKAARDLTAWGAAVVLIHHDTKADGGTPRGHSILNGALDVALHVKRDDSGIIRGKLTKNRNGTCDRDIAFTIATENGGTDEDGDTITLPRCNPCDQDDGFGVKLNRSERVLYSIACDLSDLPENLEYNRTFVENDLREAAAAGQNGVSEAASRHSRIKAYRRAFQTLAGHGILSRFTDDLTGDERIKVNYYNALDNEGFEGGT